MSTARNDTALIQYTVAIPKPAMTNPASAGPAMAAACIIMLLSVSAFVRCSLETRLGARAWRAGLSNAIAADEHAASA